VSENGGLKKFADAIMGRFPELDVKHIGEREIWSMR